MGFVGADMDLPWNLKWYSVGESKKSNCLFISACQNLQKNVCGGEERLSWSVQGALNITQNMDLGILKYLWIMNRGKLLVGKHDQS